MWALPGPQMFCDILLGIREGTHAAKLPFLRSNLAPCSSRRIDQIQLQVSEPTSLGLAGNDAYGSMQRRASGAWNESAGSGRSRAHESSFGGAARREDEGEWGDGRREEYVRSMRASTDEQFPGLQFGRGKAQQGKQVGLASDPCRFVQLGSAGW